MGLVCTLPWLLVLAAGPFFSDYQRRYRLAASSTGLQEAAADPPVADPAQDLSEASTDYTQTVCGTPFTPRPPKPPCRSFSLNPLFRSLSFFSVCPRAADKFFERHC